MEQPETYAEHHTSWPTGAEPSHRSRGHLCAIKSAHTCFPRVPCPQSEFFERAANGLSRREYVLGLCAAGASPYLHLGLFEGGREVWACPPLLHRRMHEGPDGFRRQPRRAAPMPASPDAQPPTYLTAGLAGILLWGAHGSADVKLPITVGPQQTAQVGPRGRL